METGIKSESNLTSIWRAKAHIVKALPLAIAGAGLGAAVLGLGGGAIGGITGMAVDAISGNPDYFAISTGAKIGASITSTIGAFAGALKIGYSNVHQAEKWNSFNSSDPKHGDRENGQVLASLTAATAVTAVVQYVI